MANNSTPENQEFPRALRWKAVALIDKFSGEKILKDRSLRWLGSAMQRT
jgi:hypothetical protein